jgi:hypothetical protein
MGFEAIGNVFSEKSNKDKSCIIRWGTNLMRIFYIRLKVGNMHLRCNGRERNNFETKTIPVLS